MKTLEERNKETVIEAFDAAFNRRDMAAFERFWSPNYIQHSAHIPPGREGLYGLINTLPASARYEHSLIIADRDMVMMHGRFSGISGPSWIVVDIIRLEDGVLVEHWDVIQDEATLAQSKSGAPMFGDSFPN